MSVPGGEAGNAVETQLSSLFNDDTPQDWVSALLQPKKDCGQCPYATEEWTSLRGWRKWRQSLHLFLDSPESSSAANVFSIFIMICILVSTTAFILETIPELVNDERWSVWMIIECTVTVIFTLEFVSRLLVTKNRLRFLRSMLNLVDLLAIIPFYVELAVGGTTSDSQALRVIRVIRLARVFRLFKRSHLRIFMEVLLETLRRSSDAFGLIFSLITLAVIVFSSLIYFAERNVERGCEFLPILDPVSAAATGESKRVCQHESPFISIPAAMYWAMVTMTTVGYGDLYPVTTLGKCISMITMLCGLMVLAFPVIIIGTNFEAIYSEMKQKSVSLHQAAVNKELKRQYAQLSFLSFLEENETEVDLVLGRMVTLLHHLDQRVMRQDDGKAFMQTFEEMRQIMSMFQNAKKEAVTKVTKLVNGQIASGELNLADNASDLFDDDDSNLSISKPSKRRRRRRRPRAEDEDEDGGEVELDEAGKAEARRKRRERRERSTVFGSVGRINDSHLNVLISGAGEGDVELVQVKQDTLQLPHTHSNSSAFYSPSHSLTHSNSPPPPSHQLPAPTHSLSHPPPPFSSPHVDTDPDITAGAGVDDEFRVVNIPANRAWSTISISASSQSHSHRTPPAPR